MAATVRPMVANMSMASRQMRLAELSADTSYPTGGYSVTPTSVGLSRIDAIVPLHNSGHILAWDKTNSKVKFIVSSTGAEVANATSLSGTIVQLLIIGE